MGRVRRAALAVGVTLAAALWLTGPALLGRAALGPAAVLDQDPLYRTTAEVPPGQTFNDASPFVLDLPRDFAFARGVREGRIDSWNPLSGCGAPLWAEHGGPFLPLKLPFYLWPSPRGYDLFLALRLMVAGLGAFLLGRRRGLSMPAALVAATLFECSGAAIAHLAFATASATYLVPWLLLGARWIADRPALRSAALAAIALGVTASSGHPTLILMAFSAFAASVAGHALAARRSPRRAARVLGCAALAVVLGLLLAAPSLLPFNEMRGLGRSYKDTPWGARVHDDALDNYRHTAPLALAAPHLLERFHGELGRVFPYALAPTLGVLGLTLALAGLLRLDASLLLPLILGLGLAIEPPGLAFLHSLPGLRLIMPQYPWSLVLVPLSLAAGHALDALASRRGRVALVIALGVVCCGAALIGPTTKDDPNRALYLGRLVTEALHGTAGRVALVAPLLMAALAVGCAVVRPRRGVAAAVGALAVLELAWAVTPCTRGATSAVMRLPPSPAVEFLRARLDGQSRMHAMPYTVGFPNTPALHGLADLREVAALPLLRLVDYLGAISEAVSFTIQSVDTGSSPLLDRAAVRWVAIERTTGDAPANVYKDDPLLQLAFTGPSLAIYENRAALPRTRIAHDYVDAPDPAAARAALARLDGAAKHAKASTPVVLEPDAAGRPAVLPPAAPPPGPPAVEEARLVAGTNPDRVAIQAHLERPGFVVIADTYYPGWSATVDGEPASLHPAEALFRAVPVAAGDHLVVLSYRPTSLRLAFGLSATALCLILVVLLRRSRPAPAQT